jgi:alpha-tubulin suppressor-like RCC1 family protein
MPSVVGTAVQVVVNGAPLSQVVSVSAGSDRTLAVRADGTVWRWGAGYSVDAWDSIPVQIIQADGLPLNNVSQVIAGSFWSLARKADGTVWAWGSNNAHMLRANSNSEIELYAKQVLNEDGSPLTGVVKIACGGQHQLFLKQDGTVWGWGSVAYDVLGNPDAPLGAYFVRAEIASGVPLVNVVDISVGTVSSYAIRSDGTLWSWGNNAARQLGLRWTGNVINRPTQVVDADGRPIQDVESVCAGSIFAIIRKSDGTILACGGNQIWSGQGLLSTGSNAVAVDFPEPVIDSVGAKVSNVVSMSVWSDHVLFVDASGRIWGWRNNLDGQLGDLTNTIRTRPVRAMLNSSV